MSEGYKIKIHTHSPKAANKLIGNIGLLDMIKDYINSISKSMSETIPDPVLSPFAVLKLSDFNTNDKIVTAFFENKMQDLFENPIENYDKLIKSYNNLNNIRLSNFRSNLRLAYNSVQNIIDKENDAVKLERVASKLSDKSSGSWQIESLSAIDESFKYADTNNSNSLKIARDLILTGEKNKIAEAGVIVKNLFENVTSKSNTRLAYTTLSTQDNEPYLLCPKGNFQGKYAVPMEVSKCRENCIDSRVAKDGTVTCAYQDWLKVAFEPQNKVLGRLDVHRHPDNEQNLNLAEGERSKKLTEGEFGYEYRLERSEQGANKIRNSDKNYYSESREKQLSDRKPSEWGHVGSDEPVKAPKQSQSDAKKTINTQLEPERKNQPGNEFLEALLRKLNDIDVDGENTREQQLAEDGLQAHRGEMESSYSEQLDEKKRRDPIYYRDELNKEKPESTESTSNLLNKTAKKEMTQEELLEEPRHQSKGDKTTEENLKSHRTNKGMSDEAIEALLEKEDDWDFTDEEFEGFMNDLGLDSKLEDSRNTYKLEP